MTDEDPFEQRLRAWGTAARDDAPNVRLPGSRLRRRTPLLAVAASAVIVLAVVSTAIALRPDSRSAPRPDTAPAASAPGALPVGGRDCPARFDPSAKHGISDGWVPSAPYRLGRDRLVPATPSMVTVCRYDGHRRDGSTVEVPDDSIKAMTADLNSAPAGSAGACRTYLAPTDTQNFLLRMDYANDAVTWVSAPGNHCAGSTNGTFRSSRNLRIDAAQLYRSGRWSTEPAATAGCARPSNRGPDSNPVVPSGSRAVTVCLRERDDADTVRAYVYRDGEQGFADALGRQPRYLAPPDCVVPRQGGTMLLTFSYAARPDVRIAVADSCANGTPAGAARADHYFGTIRSDLERR